MVRMIRGYAILPTEWIFIGTLNHILLWHRMGAICLHFRRQHFVVKIPTICMLLYLKGQYIGIKAFHFIHQSCEAIIIITVIICSVMASTQSLNRVIVAK